MRLSALLTIGCGFLLVCALVSAGLTYLAIDKTRQWDDRIALAQSSFAEHQALQSNIYRLFKEHADDLLIGNRDNSALEGKIKADISANLDNLHDIITQEIKIAGDSEVEELQMLAELERQIEYTLDQYTEILARNGAVAGQMVADLGELLDEEIDVELSALISLALAGEMEEVAETQAEAAEFRRLMGRIALAMIGLMVIAAAGLIILYRRYASQPLQALVSGAKAYSTGDFSQPIPVAGAAELQSVAMALSAMAGDIGARQRELTELAHKNEGMAAERTLELQVIMTRFEQAEETRRQMMADVSHELRTPLTIIQGEADIALRGGGPDMDQFSESFSRIRDAARHTNQIVDDLLLIAREEAGQLRLDLRSVDLDAALAEAATLAQASVEVMRLGHPAQCRIDPVRLRQCILAVMNNAVRYGGTRVRAWIERSGDWYDVYIEDNGPGLSDADKEQAFVRFFRGSGAQGTGVEGTGLGLPIVRSIMTAHGGSVDLSDRNGGGLVVRMRFPHPVRSVSSSRNPISRNPAKRQSA